MENIVIRKGVVSDMKQVHALIVELAVYEKEPEAVATTPATLEKDGFGAQPLFECLVAEAEGKIIGFALYYFGYSTWKGRTLYLEDFLVTESWRKHGVGAKIFKAVVAKAKEMEVKRMDWQVIDWNIPAIEFYKKNGATLDGEWINGRLFSNDLKDFEV